MLLITCYYPRPYDIRVHHNADKTITYQLDQIEKNKWLYYKLENSHNNSILELSPVTIKHIY